MDKFWELYTEAFPESERRNQEKQEHIMKDARYQIMPINHEGEMIGFYCVWNVGSFVFLEHVAIDKKFRGFGFGSFVLEALKKENKQVILEVEPPQTAQAVRRIEFYKKNGFVLNNYPYFQPPYKDGWEPVELLIMSWPYKLSENAFKEVRDVLYKEIYNFSLQG